jgi:hypothetical protein
VDGRAEVDGGCNAYRWRRDRPSRHPDVLVRPIWSSTVGSCETASGACRASARKVSISVSTELIHGVFACSSSHPRRAADSGSAWTSLTTAPESR